MQYTVGFAVCAGVIVVAIAAVILAAYLVRKRRHGTKRGSDYWIAQSGLGLHERTNNTTPISTMVWKDNDNNGDGPSRGVD